MAKDLAYYMALPYTFEVIHDEDGWFAKCKELKGCMTYADTWEELGEMIQDAKLCWIEGAIKDNDPIPEPTLIQV